MKISQFVTLSEVIKSQSAVRYGLENMPDDAVLQNLVRVCDAVFDKVRLFFGCPIAITSGYRSEEVNKIIGGAENSQHTQGQAIDIDADVFGGITNAQIFNFIKDHLDFDQLIWEFGDGDNPAWVHVSYVEGKNRKEVLKAVTEKGKAVYKKRK